MGRSLKGFFSVFVFLTTMASAEAQATHSYALLGIRGDEVDFLDLATRQETTTGEKVAWVLIVNGDAAPTKESHKLIQTQVACSTSEWRIRYAITYDRNGVAIDSGAGDGVATPVIPGSLGDVIANMLCKNVDPFPDTKSVSDTGDAIAIARAALKSDKPAVGKKPSEPRSVKPAVSGSRGGI